MIPVLAVLGWGLAAVLAVALVRLMRRVELTARAEHELRGPLGSITLGVRSLRRAGGGEVAVAADAVAAIEAELERARMALADLDAARRGRRAAGAAGPVALEPLVRATGAGFAALARRAGGELEVDWRAGAAIVRADRGRLAQVLGNLLANAVEHGRGHIRLRGVPIGDRVRIEVNDSDRALHHAGPRREHHRPLDKRGRGRGLAIAAQAVEDAGGSLSIDAGERGASVAFELPLAE